MDDLYTRLTDLCKQKGVSGYKFCRDTNLQPSLLTDLKVGRQHNVSPKKAAKIAEYFGVSTDFILYGEEKEKTATNGDDLDNLSEKDKRFIEWFRSLSEEKQKAILISQDAPADLL